MPRASRWADVVEAAARVFSEKGFGGASLEDVANEVGMLKGSLYNYIKSKEDLLFAVVRPDAEELLAKAREMRGIDLPATEKIRRITQTHVDIIERHLPYVSVYVQEVAGRGLSEEWAQMDREYVEIVVGIFTEGVDSGSFDPGLNPEISARALIGALNWMTRWYRPGDPVAARSIASQLADTFLLGALNRTR